jgi:hypothetical protein
MSTKFAYLMIFASFNTNDFPPIYKSQKKKYKIYSPEIYEYEDNVQRFKSVI